MTGVRLAGVSSQRAFGVGRLWYRLSTRFRHGPLTAWRRDVTRWKILASSPVGPLSDDSVELHVLTSTADWINLAWALKSFYLASGKHYRAVIHDDGTLGSDACGDLMRLFPGCRIIGRKEADAWAEHALARYPRSLEFRRTNHLAPKVFDFAGMATSNSILVFDSDLLFFGEPVALIRQLEAREALRNAWNRDATDCYTISPAAAKQLFGIDLHPRVNSGLGVVHRGSIRVEWIEEFLGAPGVVGHFWRIEQTLYALCSSRFGVDLLPAEYDVHLGARTIGPVRHYVGAIRHQMYQEGMTRLAKTVLR